MKRLIARLLLRLEYSIHQTEAYLAEMRNDYATSQRSRSSAHECAMMLEWLR